MTQRSKQPRRLTRKELHKTFKQLLKNGLKAPLFWILMPAKGEQTSGHTDQAEEHTINDLIIEWDCASGEVPLPAELFVLDGKGDGTRVSIQMSGKAQCLTMPLSKYKNMQHGIRS